MNYQRVMQDLYYKAPPRIRKRAWGYYYEDRIESLRITEDGVLRAKVQGSQPEPYDVEINLSHRRRKCSCPAHRHYRDIPCKHQVLAVLPFIGANAERR